MRGRLAIDDPRRCQKKPGKKGPCFRLALKGYAYCQFHSGPRNPRYAVEIDHLPRFYSKHLKGTLQQCVEEALQEDVSETLELYEELAMARRTVVDIALLYEACIDNENVEPAKRIEVGMLLREGLKDIDKMVTSAFAIEANRRDKISAHNLNTVVNQIVRVAAEVFGDDEVRAKRFEYMIRTHVKVDDGRPGTSLTPDKDAQEMDASVPDA